MCKKNMKEFFLLDKMFTNIVQEINFPFATY
jgi:hypothetical protein